MVKPTVRNREEITYHPLCRKNWFLGLSQGAAAHDFNSTKQLWIKYLKARLLLCESDEPLRSFREGLLQIPSAIEIQLMPISDKALLASCLGLPPERNPFYLLVCFLEDLHNGLLEMCL